MKNDDHARYHYHEEPPEGPIQWQFDEKTAALLREMAEQHEHKMWLRQGTGRIFRIFVYVAGSLITLKMFVVDWLWKFIVHVRIGQ
jgi:hypothetical protein